MASINQHYSMLDDPLVDAATGLTNIVLTERNNLFPKNMGGEYRRVEEQQVSPDHVYCTFRDIEATPVMRRFFSKANVDYLQAEMIKQVYIKSCGNFKISRQSTDELLIIMRSMYLQYTRNLPFDIDGQVAELNKQVLLYAVPNIITRAQGFLGYMRDQETPNKFISNPNFVSDAGTRFGDFSSLII
jgi:hypothetical protein